MDELPGPPLPAIGDYGVVGDTRTAALCSPTGSIDWLCLPRFDADPVFGRLVGGEVAGSFLLGPPDAGARLVRRRYLPGSAVLETTWRTDTGELTLTEGMVADLSGSLMPAALLVRRLACRGGPARVRVRFDPRRGADHRPPRVQRRGDVVVCTWGGLAVSLSTTGGLTVEPGRELEVVVEEQQPVTFAMAAAQREPLVDVPAERAFDELLRTDAWWRGWSAGIGDVGPYRDATVRSLVTLKLLTYSPSGAPVAAVTTSLPEELGGGRNWDYRYAWPRDASIGIAAFLGAGKDEEARAFLYWLLHASRLDRPRLPPVLTLDGTPVPAEQELEGWPGYADSRPVRAGNGARDQHQLDVYGWVVDAAWVLAQAGHGLYRETWRAMAGFADLVARRWTEPDAGIWEVRSRPRHHVHSKLMAWLALDRALRLADAHGARAGRRSRWATARSAVAADVVRHGFDERRRTFVAAYGEDELDAAVLILPVIGLEDPGSPRVLGTIEAVRASLGAGGPLLYRYRPGRDGVPGKEGAFLACSFWLVQALALAGRAEEAAGLFEELIGLGGDLGLLAEEVDPSTASLIGNYPQALSHAALVQAALALRDAGARDSGQPGPTSPPNANP
ncbi:MAG TPA: glycoside hydrolase family 15 protein [Acidimicrobiales bacterium]|nr:glycoside hydrolase family 15 protein [Acidimicrobiales bacterium]